MIRPLLLLALLLAATAEGASAQLYRLTPPEPSPGDFFGGAVDLDGDRALIGASGEDGCGENSGAAYIYERVDSTGVWVQSARLAPALCMAGSYFGRALALSGDRALIAASRPPFDPTVSDAAYLFERDPETGAWRETARLTARETGTAGSFASSVALEGDRALVTMSGDTSENRYGGAAFIFERDPKTGRWRQQARLAGSGPLGGGIFGGSGALSGDRVAVSASTYFARRPGTVYLFERDARTGAWRETARLTGIEGFFIPVELDGDRLLVGQSRHGRRRAGAATVYEPDASGAWRPAAALTPSRPYQSGSFGISVSLDGDRALVSGYEEQLGLDFNVDRVVYVFRRDPATGRWHQQQIIDIGEWGFGVSMAQDAGRALIGQTREPESGAAFIVDFVF